MTRGPDIERCISTRRELEIINLYRDFPTGKHFNSCVCHVEWFNASLRPVFGLVASSFTHLKSKSHLYSPGGGWRQIASMKMQGAMSLNLRWDLCWMIIPTKNMYFMYSYILTFLRHLTKPSFGLLCSFQSPIL